MPLSTLLRGYGRPVRGAALAVALGGALAACDVDSILEVPDPDVATPASVQDPAALPAVRAGAIGDVALAITGSGGTEDGLTQYTGLLTDELVWAETFPTREQIDRRNVETINGTMETLFSNVQRGRASAERAARGYTALLPDAAPRSEMHSLAGFMYTLIGEAYCSGVPFSQVVDGVPEYGAPFTTAQTHDRAVALFDSALAAPGATPTFVNLGRVGRARALVNLGRYTDAAAAVAAVPTSFVYNLEYSENSARQNNGIFQVVQLNRRFSPVGSEGTNGLPYRNDNDPRVVAPRGTGAQLNGFDNATPLFLQTKYGSRTAPFALATGIEARLIEAEAFLKAGNADSALARLNALRAAPTVAGSGGVAGLTPLTLQGTTAAQVDQLFKERAYWLWLTSHRLGDLRRLVRPVTAGGYGRSAESVFPTGTFFKGGTYGPDVNFPIPFSERNNPEYLQAGAACINRDA